jgi:hypothetical protein
MAGSEHEAVVGLPTHPSQLAELVRDVGAYLVGEGTCEGARKLVGAHAFRHAQADFEAFAASQRTATDVVWVDLEIRGEGRELHSVYGQVPGPLTLLLVCARNCRDGDHIVLRQRTAKCGLVTHEVRWPFGMQEAELITRPASGLFHELAETGTRAAHSREHALGVFGRIVIRSEQRDERVQLPRLVPVLARRPRLTVGLRWRWRGRQVRVAWRAGYGPASRR